MRRELPFIPVPDCQLFGAMYHSDNPFDLGQDMLDVILPTGVLVSAGWYPEGNANGSYRISVRMGLDDVIEPLTTRDFDEAMADIQNLAMQYSYRHCHPMGSATDFSNRELQTA